MSVLCKECSKAVEDSGVDVELLEASIRRRREILKLCEEKLSYRQIAERVGRSERQVIRIAKSGD